MVKKKYPNGKQNKPQQSHSVNNVTQNNVANVTETQETDGTETTATDPEDSKTVETTQTVDPNGNDEVKVSFIERIGLKLAKKSVATLNQKIKHLENDLAEKKNNLEQLSSEKEKADIRIMALKEEKKHLSVELEHTLNENKQLEADITEINNNSSREMESAKQQANQSLENYKNELVKLMQTYFPKDFKNGMTVKDGVETISECLKKCQLDIEKQKDIVVKAEEEKQKAIKEAENKAMQIKQNAEAIKNEAEKTKADTKRLIDEINTSDKGELTNKLKEALAATDQCKNELAEKNADITRLTDEGNAKDKKISDLEKNVDALKVTAKKAEDDNKNEINKIKELYRSELEESKITHKKELEDLKSSQKERVDKLKQNHEENVATMKRDHEAFVEKIKDNAQNELQKKDDDHTAEVNVLKETAARQEAKLQNKISEQTDTINDLTAQLQKEADSLRASAQDTASKLHAFLKEHDVMTPCCVDYQEKVAEKNQDLVIDAAQLVKDINELTTAITPSEWTTTLLCYIKSLIKENTSVINRILKYYAMSNVPFMIDNNRDNGLCFVRANIKEAANAIISILAQCGVSPIIPSLFVENITEGEYEEEGQFNDIESFCPGSINEHIAHIERASDGLNGVIIGVTRVGYHLPDGDIQKAQVIIP